MCPFYNPRNGRLTFQRNWQLSVIINQRFSETWSGKRRTLCENYCKLLTDNEFLFINFVLGAVPTQGEGGCPVRTRGVLQMRTSALLMQKISDFFKFTVCPHGQEGKGWVSADILWARGDQIFASLCRRPLWTAPYFSVYFSNFNVSQREAEHNWTENCTERLFVQFNNIWTTCFLNKVKLSEKLLFWKLLMLHLFFKLMTHFCYIVTFD